MSKKTHMFKGASFGDIFQTRDGCRALYIGSRDSAEWPSFAPHLLYIEEVGWSYFYEDGFDSGGVASYDIVGRWEYDSEDERTLKLAGNQIAHLYDLLGRCARYISAAEKRGKRADELLHDIADSRELLNI